MVLFGLAIAHAYAFAHTNTHTHIHTAHSIPPHIRTYGWNKPNACIWRARVLQIRAKDEAGVSALADTLGSGDALKSKLNQALEAQGLEPSTGVSNPQVHKEEEEEERALSLSPRLSPCLHLFLCLALVVRMLQ